MNPYQKTADEMKRQSEAPKKLLKKAGAIGSSLGALSFAPVLSKAAPFLSEYIPESLAIKGLSKVNNQFGEFINKAMNSGYDFSEIKNFLGDQVKESQEAESLDIKDILNTDNANLYHLIKLQLKRGVSKDEIEKSMTKKWNASVKDLMKKYKMSFKEVIDWISSNNAEGDTESKNVPQNAQLQANTPSAQGNVQSNTSNMGTGQQAMLDILQQIKQTRKP